MANLKKLEARFEAALATLGTGGEDTDKLNQRVSELEKALSVATDNANKSKKALDDVKKELDALREETNAQDEMDEEDFNALNRRVENLTRAQEDAYEDRNRAKKYNQYIRKLNAELRKSNEANLENPEAINKGLESEVEQMKTQRDQDVAEINSILEQLKPLVEGSKNG